MKTGGRERWEVRDEGTDGGSTGATIVGHSPTVWLASITAHTLMKNCAA
jgi:hypothetical protein